MTSVRSFSAAARNSAATNEQADNWKAAAFINLSVELKDGSKVSLGKTGIGLRASNEFEAALAEKLLSDPDFAQAFADKLVITVRSAESSSSKRTLADLA